MITLNIAKHPDFTPSVSIEKSAKTKTKTKMKMKMKTTDSDNKVQDPSDRNQRSADFSLANGSSNNNTNESGSPKNEKSPISGTKKSDDFTPPSIDAVITISPRRGTYVRVYVCRYKHVYSQTHVRIFTYIQVNHFSIPRSVS